MENLTIDCGSDEALTSLKKYITTTKKIIIGEIQDLARNDDKEFSRIKCVWARADFLVLPKDLHEKFFTDSELVLLNEFKDIEPSIKEIYLSMALNLCQQASAKTRFSNGAGLSIFWLMRANELIGRAKGYDEGKEISDEKTEVIKQQIYKKASDIRHQENREMKAQVIKHYKENKEAYKNKDEAAMDLKRIVPASFSTIRCWLKNI